MSEDRLITVAIHTYEKAVMLKSLLESEGVPVVLHNVNLDQPIVSSGIRVRIKEKDLPLALRIIENVDIFSNANKSPKSPQKIIVPIDFSDSSLYATRFAFNYAKSYNHSIVFLHSYLDPFLSGGIQLSNSKDFDLDITDSREKAQAQAEEDMDKFCREVRHLIKIGDIPPIKFSSEIREGVPEDVINSYAKQIHPTSIIMGTRGYGKKEKELIGSVTAEVLDTCRYPVFSIPEDAPLRTISDVRNIAFICNLDQDDILAIDAILRLLDGQKLNITLIFFKDRKINFNNIRPIDGLLNYCHTNYPHYQFNAQELPLKNITFDFKQFLATNNFSLIAIPNKKKNIIARLFNPSIAHRLLFNVDIPMMVIPV